MPTPCRMAREQDLWMLKRSDSFDLDEERIHRTEEVLPERNHLLIHFGERTCVRHSARTDFQNQRCIAIQTALHVVLVVSISDLEEFPNLILHTDALAILQKWHCRWKPQSALILVCATSSVLVA